MLRDLFSLFPAYAGVIPMAIGLMGLVKAFPRICGGDPEGHALEVAIQGFSPHMRG